MSDGEDKPLKNFKRRSGKDYLTPTGKLITPLAFIHNCQVDGCDKHGGFGFRVSMLRGEPGYWYCAEHRHIGEALHYSSTNPGDHAAEGEPHEYPIDRKPADGA